MAQQSENGARLAHLLEMTIAVAVLGAVLVPALVIPAVQAARQVSWGEAQKKSEPNVVMQALSARINRAKQLRGPELSAAPRVTAEFAIDSVRKLADRFDISRQLVIARPDATDADVERLVSLMKMGEAPQSAERSSDLLAWEWLIYCDAVNLSNSQVTDAGVELLAQLPQVQDLNLSDTRITDKGLAHVGRLRNLTQLDLSGTDITDEGLGALASCEELETLNLSRTAVGDQGLPALAGHENLTGLFLADTKVTGASLETIAGLSSLHELNLDGCSISDQHVPSLASLQGLTYLSMRNTQIGDEGAAVLADFEGLWDLHLEGTRLGRKGRVMLKAALPECALSL